MSMNVALVESFINRVVELTEQKNVAWNIVGDTSPHLYDPLREELKKQLNVDIGLATNDSYYFSSHGGLVYLLKYLIPSRSDDGILTWKEDICIYIMPSPITPMAVIPTEQKEIKDKISLLYTLVRNLVPPPKNWAPVTLEQYLEAIITNGIEN